MNNALHKNLATKSGKLLNFVSRFALHVSRFIFKPGTWGAQRAADACIIFFFAFCILSLLTGCVQKSDLEEAQGNVRQSQDYYQRAIAQYEDLISRGRDLDRLYFELGKLYYSHGRFQEAIGQIKKSNIPEAKKFLAVSYYRLSNFTDALEVFDKNENMDDECLYYYGLTSENLSLFDKALDIYKKIKPGEYSRLALERVNLIEKQADLANIKQVSPEAADILANAPSEEEYPQAGALILSYDEGIRITPENTQVSVLHYLIKILNERGKENFSESHIEYDSTYEKVELEYARTIKPDGSVVEVGSRHIRDVSKYLNFPLYSNVRVYIISFPEITEGAAIEYKIRIQRSQLVNKKDFVLSYPIQATEPIISGSFSIELPADRALYIKTLNERYNLFQADLKPGIEKKDGRLLYSWQFKDIPQIIPESNMPAPVEINPAILISTFNNWQDIYNWWWPLAQDKIKADSAIKEKVKELTANQNSDEEKARAIYNFCAKDIRYVAVEYGQAGYQPHSAADIFKNKYGDCKDQAILLATMLGEAGLSAYPALISTREYYNLNKDFPALFFNHCIAALSLKDKIIFLDPTASTCAFGDLPVDDQARGVLIFKGDSFEIDNTPLFAAGHNLIKQSLGIKINRDESISAKKDVFTYGMYDQAQRFWILYTPPELIREALKEKIQDISIGAKLNSYSIKNSEDLNQPIALSYDFSGAEYFTEAGNLRVMPQLANLGASLVAKDERKYPLDFAALDIKEANFEIEIPDNFAIKYIPQDLSQDSPWLKFTVEYKHQGSKIISRQKTELKKSVISQEEYPAFKAFFQNLAKRIKQRIILEKFK